jgi:hypothetical protein
MKNIHVISTDKPSRLVIDTIENKLYYQPILHNKTVNVLPQNIYITSDEEIKEGDWYLVVGGIGLATNTLYKSHGDTPKNDWLKKIILTTDQDLIKDSVQAINDEFLEWFVKNPSCEEVEVQDISMQYHDEGYYEYKIIIPKEEPNRTHWLDELPNMDKDILAKMWESAMPKLESKQEIITGYKQDTIQLIENRILSEYKKHSTSLPNEWAKIAAHKIHKSISDKMEKHKQSVEEYEQQGLEKYFEEPKKEVTGVDDNRPKPNYCYAKEKGHGEIGCVFPACHCGLPIKQETLEEAAKRIFNIPDDKKGDVYFISDIAHLRKGFKFGAKWQSERMYSEEEVI